MRRRLHGTMTPKLVAITLLLTVLKLAHPAVADSDLINSEEIVPPSLSSSPLLVNSPDFIPSELVFLRDDNNNAVTSDATVENEDQRVGDDQEDGTSSDTIRPPPSQSVVESETSWEVTDNDDDENQTEQLPTTPADQLAVGVVPKQAIPIEAYVVNTDRKAKSELQPPNRTMKEPFLRDQSVSLQQPEEAIKNLTLDVEDFENALFNDTTGSTFVDESLDSSNESSDESIAVTEIVAPKESSPIAASTTTTTTTAVPPPTSLPVLSNNQHNLRKKQPKYIKKFRASASEVLRFFMEGSYLRSPLAVLVDTSDQTLQKTKILWNATLQQSTSNMDIVLVSFDHSGIYATYKFNNSRTLVAGLNSIQPTSKTDHEISAHTDNVFSTIIRASERIPYDSAIFLFTNAEPAEDEVAQNAAIMLLKKRIRLYLFWFGGVVDNDPESPINTNHQHSSGDVAGILGDVTLRTGGEIVYMSGEAIHDNGDIGTVTLQLRNSFQGVQPFGVPLSDSDTTNSLNRSHESSEEAKVPAEESSLSVAGRKRTNSGEHSTQPRSINNAKDLHDLEDAEIFFSPETMNEVSLRISENFRFPDNDRQSSVLENEEATNNAIDVDQEQNIDDVEILIPSDGKETRQASIESNTQVQVSPQSKLSSLPGTQAQIIFEVTNLRSVPTRYFFNVIDELQYVRQTQPPYFQLVQPGQTLAVTVVLWVPPTAVAGVRNKVTLTARGVTDVQQAVYFTVAGQTSVQDSWAPSLYWTYGSRCEWKTSPGVCSQHVWSVEITAQDWDTGILRLQSQPRGLLLRNRFTAGTREVVTATYSASCCQPRVTITAYDAANNQKSVTLDVTDIWLSEAAIAAIVVGVILLIVLVILIVFCCVWCIRRRRQSQELPVYRSRARSRQES